jgi:hypothetical protein
MIAWATADGIKSSLSRPSEIGKMVVLVGRATRDCSPALKEGSRTGARRVSLYRLESIETSVLRARHWFDFEGRRVALIVEPHPKRQSQVSEDRFDLIERLAAKVLDLQQFLFSALHQLADIFDIGVPQSVKRTHRKRQSLDWAKKDLVHRHGCDLILEPVISGKKDQCPALGRFACDLRTV